MSEQTNPPVAEGGRRRPAGKSAESSGGGFKVIAIILFLVVVALGFALNKRGAGAAAQADTDAKSIVTFSNQVAEFRTKLALEQSNVEVARSNYQALLHRGTAELNLSSNRLVQTALALDIAREEKRAAQTELPAKAAAIATLEAQRDELQRQVAQIPALQREVADWKEKFQQTQFAQAKLQETLGRVQTEKAALERNLEDSAFLRLQAKRADEASEMRQRSAANQRINPSDPRVRLDLQPDGTVRPALTENKAPAKN